MRFPRRGLFLAITENGIGEIFKDLPPSYVAFGPLVEAWHVVAGLDDRTSLDASFPYAVFASGSEPVLMGTFHGYR